LKHGDVSVLASSIGIEIDPKPLQGLKPIQGEIHTGHNVGVTVNIANNEQASTTTKGDGKAIGDALGAMITQRLIQEKRPGGLLY
jgi:hypothetical protein